ncbi:MAG TPA: hypothetical protein VG095_06955, partial [Chthoniobacterales bacterium]|nr:hypothetical protein [Chthoniobacterales bacterium]
PRRIISLSWIVGFIAVRPLRCAQHHRWIQKNFWLVGAPYCNGRAKRFEVVSSRTRGMTYAVSGFH